MITVDKEKAIQLLYRAVAEKGADYVYPRSNGNVFKGKPSCSYQQDGQPSCLVGHAIWFLQPDSDLLIQLDASGAIGSEAQEVLLAHGIQLTDEAVHVLRAAQHEQDARKPWGEAVKVATDIVDDIYADFDY